MRFLFTIFLLSISLFASQSKVTYIGNPYQNIYKSGEHIYSRNIWDMQLYNGKIYIGAGNSSNIGPSINSGRVSVFSLNPITDKISFEYKVAEEQVNIFKVYDDILYIPGHDSTQKWEYGNFYTKYNGTWKKYRTIPNALHVYDLVKKDRTIYVALGLNHSGAIAVSKDNGYNWEIIKTKNGRVYSLFILNNKIYIDKQISKKNKTTRIKKIKNKILYISAKKHNDHQSLPNKLFIAKEINNKIISINIKLPTNNIPRDILVRNDNIFILTSKTIKNKTEIKVLKYRYNIFNKYKEIISFKYDTFARSFEEVNGNFYFGMGCEIKNPNKWSLKELNQSCGNILKVRG